MTRVFGLSTSSVPICYVIGSLDVGGAESQLLRLALDLDRSEFAPVIVCLTHAGTMYETARAAGLRLRVLGLEDTRWPRVYWVRELRRCLAEERIPLAHGFLFPTYSLLAVAAANAGNTAVVAGVRSLGLGLERTWYGRRLEPVGHRLTDRIVANSQAVREALLRRDPRVASKVEVIYNGVEIRRFELSEPPSAIRREIGIARGDFLVAMVANLIAYKGHREVLRAFHALRRAGHAAKLALVGSGPCEPALRALTEELGLGDHVLFLGYRRDVPRILAAADLVVQGSYEEGFPNAILEAMAAGKPVVATRVGGVVEQVVPSVTGLLVEPRDVPGMAAALTELVQDPERMRAMGRAARERARTLFSWEQTLSRYVNLYRSLLA